MILEYVIAGLVGGIAGAGGTYILARQEITQQQKDLAHLRDLLVEFQKGQQTFNEALPSEFTKILQVENEPLRSVINNIDSNFNQRYNQLDERIDVAEQETLAIREAIKGLNDTGDKIESKLQGILDHEHSTKQNLGQLAQDISELSSTLKTLLPKLMEKVELIPSTRPVKSEEVAPHWRIGDPTKPAIEIEAVVDIMRVGAIRTTSPMMSSANLNKLSSFVEKLPGLANAIQSRKILKVVFSPAMQQQLDSGAAVLTKSGSKFLPIAHDPATGQFLEIGRISSSVNWLAVGSGLFQLGSFIFAQAHLAGIRHELKKINAKLDEIQGRLSSDALGAILGDHIYVESLFEDLSNSDLDYSRLHIYHAELERIERSSLATAYAALIRLQSKLAGIQLSTERFGSEEEFKTVVDTFERETNLILAANCVRVRAIAVSRVLFVADRMPARQRNISDLANEVDELCVMFFDMMDKRVPNGAYWWRLWREDRSVIAKANDLQQATEDRIVYALNELADLQDRIVPLFEDKMEPVTIYLERALDSAGFHFVQVGNEESHAEQQIDQSMEAEECS